MSPRGRRLASRLLVVLASVAIVLTLVVGYVRHAAVDSNQFANRATVVLQDKSVRSLIAQRVTDDVVLEKQGDLLAARPIIEAAVSGIVGSRPFTTLFRAGVRDVHRALFDRDQHTVTLTLADVGTMVAAALEAVRPSLARRIQTTTKVKVVRRDIGSFSATAARAADTIKLVAALLLLLALGCAVGAIWLSVDRRRTFVHLGVGAAIGGLLLVV